MALPLLKRESDDTPGMDHPFEVLGEFDLVHFIGRGGMGEVWLAVRRGTMRPLAIKVLLPELARKDANVESFRREGDIGMQLAHYDHIVSVHDIHEAFVGDPACPERLLYLVLDFVDGVNLGRLAQRVYRVTRQRLPIPIVVHIVRAVLRALADAHSHKIGKSALPVVHGDIKPGNVLISSRGGVWVTDFGLSRFAPEPTFISRPAGTMPYMAPEQYLGRICPQNDLYAVGALLHELLTGEPPLPEKGSLRVLEHKLLNDPLPPLGRDDVPAALERLRRGLLEKNVALRIQTASEALEILATVDRTDCKDELANIYQRFFGLPRSGLTEYLQAQSDSRGSFLIELLQRHRHLVTSENPKREPETTPRPLPLVGATASEDHSAAGEGGRANSMPWLDEDAEDDRPTNEVRRRPAAPAASEETHVAEPRDTDRARTKATGPLLEPMEGVSDLDAAITAPRTAATAATKPVPDPRRYPPRPAHLEDGAPFQLRRPNRGRSPADGAELDAGASAEPPRIGTATGPDAGPHRTRPERSPDTRPDVPPVQPPRIPKDSSTRWLRSAFVLTTAVLAVACGTGLVALALGEPRDPLASSNDPHPALTAATSG